MLDDLHELSRAYTQESREAVRKGYQGNQYNGRPRTKTLTTFQTYLTMIPRPNGARSARKVT